MTDEPPSNDDAVVDGGHAAPSFPIPDAEWFRSETMSDETVIVARHPSVVVSISSYLFGGAVALLGMVLAVSIITNQLDNFIGTVPGILLPISGLVVLAGIAFGAWEHLSRTNTWYVVTDQQILYKTGVFNAHTDPIDFASVTEIDVERPFFLRPFGIGHIQVFAASTGGADLRLPSVPDVNVVVNTIKREKRKHGSSQRKKGTS